MVLCPNRADTTPDVDPVFQERRGLTVPPSKKVNFGKPAGFGQQGSIICRPAPFGQPAQRLPSASDAGGWPQQAAAASPPLR